MAVIYRLIRLMRPYWKLMALGLFLAFMTIASNMGLLITSAFLISWSALQPPVLDLMTLVAGVRFFGLSRAAFRYGERYVTHRAALSVLGEIKIWIYSSLAAQSPGQLLNYHSGKLLSRLVADVEALKEVYLRIFLPPLTALLVFIATVIFLGQFHWSLVMAFIGFYGLGAIVIPFGVRRLTRWQKRLGEAREELHTLLVDSLKGLTEIVAFGRAWDQRNKAVGQGNDFTSLQNRINAKNALTGALTQLVGNLAMFSILCLAIPLVTTGKLNGIWLAALALGVMASFEAVHGLAQVIPNLEESLEAGSRVLELVDTAPLVTRPEITASPSINDYTLRLDGLSFYYPGTSQPVLQDISYHIPPGGRLAIVGPSGAGKSTLAQLLLGFWDYDQGSITLGGTQLKSLSEEFLWSTISLVSRQTYLFNATVKENLLLAKPSASHEELMNAVQKAQLLPHLEILPDGIDTVVGEGGWKLSGGQRQLVALARAFLRNPPILVLDEATEGLDPITERQVLGALRLLMEGRTTIMITHRLIGLEAMDEILVLDQGQVIERGTHQELISLDGLYRHMYKLQQKN